jgi:hypothetical protein
MVQLPPAYQPPPPEVPLYRPLSPDRRPVELDPFHYTKLIQKFRRWKESDYDKARDNVIDRTSGFPEPPLNYNGPFVTPSLKSSQDTARARLHYLADIASKLLGASHDAPRPLLERLFTLISQATANPGDLDRSLVDDVPLTSGDLDLLQELTQTSWNEHIIPFGPPGSIRGFPDTDPDYRDEVTRLEQFEREVLDAPFDIPYWNPGDTAEQGSNASFTQVEYDPDVYSSNTLDTSCMQYLLNTEHAKKGVHMWSGAEVENFLRALHNHGRIQ